MMVQTITTVGPVLMALVVTPVNIGDTVQGRINVCPSPWSMEMIFQRAGQVEKVEQSAAAFNTATKDYGCMETTVEGYQVNQAFYTELVRGPEGVEQYYSTEVLDKDGLRYYALVPAHAIKR